LADQGVRIRETTPEDLPLVLRHRRGMFEDMGHRDAGSLDAMEAASRPFFERALREGHYRGFFAVDEGGRVRAGGGVVLLEYQEGYAVVFLHASDAGRPLYEELGFRATNEMRLRL